MGLLFILSIPILIGCLISYFSKNLTCFSSGWGREYKDLLNLTNDEQLLLNHLSKEAVFSKYKYDDTSFLKYEAVCFFSAALRTLYYNNRSNDKAKHICFYCDYLLCEKYLYKRYSNDDVLKLNSYLTDYDKNRILELYKNVRSLTDEEEKKLFSYEIIRRDVCYNKLIEEYKDSNQFYEDIKRLESLNDAFTVKRNFYYKAYRFMIDKDKTISLKLYIHYLSINPDSTTNLSISKANLKKLFEKEYQKKNFENVVEQFKKDNNLEKALQSIEKVFFVKRKKIRIDDDAINSATNDLNSVVEILNKYLEGEDNAESIIVEEKYIEPENKVDSSFSPIQTEFIDYFISKSYKLSDLEIDTFANSKGVFKSQLIDGFNEEYFEKLDDFLIEEIDEHYVLNKDYYRLIAKA